MPAWRRGILAAEAMLPQYRPLKFAWLPATTLFESVTSVLPHIRLTLGWQLSMPKTPLGGGNVRLAHLINCCRSECMLRLRAHQELPEVPHAVL